MKTYFVDSLTNQNLKENLVVVCLAESNLNISIELLPNVVSFFEEAVSEFKKQFIL
jgi:hypothetical protein